MITSPPACMLSGERAPSLAHLDSLPLMIWYSGLTALFFFLLARAAPAFFPTAFSVALRPLFPFRQAQYVQVFPLKPALFCTLFAGVGSTNKSAISLLLTDSFCPLLHLSSYLKLCGRSGRNCLLCPPVLSAYNGSPNTRFSLGTTRLMSWPDGERYLRPPQSLVVSLLLSLVSTLVLSQIGGVLSHRNILKHRFSRFPPRNLCSLVTLAVSSRLRCNGHSLLLGFYLSRIGRIENPSCSASGHSSQDTSHLIVHCPAADSAPFTHWRLSVSLRPLVQTLESCPASGAPWSFAMPPALGRGRVTNNNKTTGTF